MKKIKHPLAVLMIVIGLLLIFAVEVFGSWSRLRVVELLDLNNRESVIIIWDEVEKTNCYVHHKTDVRAGGSISCMRSKN